MPIAHLLPGAPPLLLAAVNLHVIAGLHARHRLLIALEHARARLDPLLVIHAQPLVPSTLPDRLRAPAREL